jgi:hypothetical protein
MQSSHRVSLWTFKTKHWILVMCEGVEVIAKYKHKLNPPNCCWVTWLWACLELLLNVWWGSSPGKTLDPGMSTFGIWINWSWYSISPFVLDAMLLYMLISGLCSWCDSEVNRKCLVLVLSLVLGLHKLAGLLFEDPGYHRHGKIPGPILILMGYGWQFFLQISARYW